MSDRLTAKLPLSTTLPRIDPRATKIAEHESAGADRGRAAVGIRRCEHQGSGANLLNRPRTVEFRDHSGMGSSACCHLQLGRVAVDDDRIGDGDAIDKINYRASGGQRTGPERLVVGKAERAGCEHRATRKRMVLLPVRMTL